MNSQMQKRDGAGTNPLQIPNKWDGVSTNPLQLPNKRDGVGANPLKNKCRNHHAALNGRKKALVFPMAPTTAHPIPWSGAGRIPTTLPRGATLRWGALRCTLRLGRTGTGSIRMNWRRGLGTFSGRRGRRRNPRCRMEGLSTRSRTNRIILVSKRYSLPRLTTVLLIGRIR